MEMSDNFAFKIALEAESGNNVKLVRALTRFYKEKEGCDDEEAKLKAQTLIEEATNQVLARLNEEFKPRKQRAKG